MTERDRLDLRGLLPPTVMSPDLQIERFSMLLYFPWSHANVEHIESMLFGGSFIFFFSHVGWWWS